MLTELNDVCRALESTLNRTFNLSHSSRSVGQLEFGAEIANASADGKLLWRIGKIFIVLIKNNSNIFLPETALMPLERRVLIFLRCFSIFFFFGGEARGE